ncbi:Queuosine salvage protein [Schistosoma japonicum]|nr:Queuosine salvage protein [Schistosoma japonicum]
MEYLSPLSSSLYIMQNAEHEGPDILNPKVYQSMTVEQLRHIFRSHTAESIPLFDERLNTLKDAGKTLLEHFNGSFKNALFSCDNSAAKLLKLLCDYFPSFRDYALYKGKQGEEIANGSELEVEIRAATISAVHVSDFFNLCLHCISRRL